MLLLYVRVGGGGGGGGKSNETSPPRAAGACFIFIFRYCGFMGRSGQLVDEVSGGEKTGTTQGLRDRSTWAGAEPEDYRVPRGRGGGLVLVSLRRAPSFPKRCFTLDSTDQICSFHMVPPHRYLKSNPQNNKSSRTQWRVVPNKTSLAFLWQPTDSFLSQLTRRKTEP